ncbi:MAG: hypothetical protein K1X35_07495 [Caulobacteraceae bacterium]|nr:hypothetical protein [Caulobacteraceae bacterium]
MTLFDLIADLDSFDPELAIYAVKPWTGSSEAMVAEAPADPDGYGAKAAGYLMGVGEAVIWLEDLQDQAGRFIPVTEAVERLVGHVAGD